MCCNHEFVSVEEITSNEDAWLRRTLREHVERTGSPRAARLLLRRGPLPMVRVQPIHLQGTVQSVWEPVLANVKCEFISVADSEAVAVAHAISL